MTTRFGGLDYQLYERQRSIQNQRCKCGCGLPNWAHGLLIGRASDRRIQTDLWWDTLDAANHDPGDEDRSER